MRQRVKAARGATRYGGASRRRFEVTQAIGFLAGLFATAAFVPQVVRAWQTRSTRDLSLLTIIAFTTGVSLWIVYGVLIHSLPVVIWNVITLLLNIGILAAKLRHG